VLVTVAFWRKGDNGDNDFERRLSTNVVESASER